MQEILDQLKPGHRVLDVGSGPGSFAAAETGPKVVRADLEEPASPVGNLYVRCDARNLPFSSGSFDAVVTNHSLEHIKDPAAALVEIGRIAKPDAFLYVAVPDASTLTDRLYRWLARGGGHVNQFTDLERLVQLIEGSTGLPATGSRLLFSSLSFLNRRNNPGRKPRRLYLLGGGAEPLLRLLILFLRIFDATAGTRAGVYGWAVWFGGRLEIDPRPYCNVCIRCGAGHPATFLLAAGLVRRGRLGLRLFRCPRCGAETYFSDDPEEEPAG